MNPDNNADKIPRVIASLEIVFGLLVPLFALGPFLALGLLFGILTISKAPITFAVSACGAYGLIGVAILLSSENKISRQRAEVASAGVVAGTLVALYFFIGVAQQERWHLDKQTVFLSAVVTGPALVGLRRVILLWKNPPF